VPVYRAQRVVGYSSFSPMVPGIIGADAVVGWFGHWPSFHDAEILSVHINRGGQSAIRIHAWRLTDRLDAAGRFVREREAVIVFEFSGVESLHLVGEDADGQNVMSGLDIERRAQSWRLRFGPCYGLSGELTVADIMVRVEPLA
jgi:hypothetical protein